MEEAIFAAGCFWGIQSEFDAIHGVLDTEVGYTGGETENPTYEEVCRKNTGHAEGVRVVFDPEIVSYESLVRAFYEMHDPTQLNRQGPDIGTQYRSAIFTNSLMQDTVANKVTADMDASGIFSRKIATQIAKASKWWPAEEYHQKYNEKHGYAGCKI